jgi:hypothetical protein
MLTKSVRPKQHNMPSTEFESWVEKMAPSPVAAKLLLKLNGLLKLTKLLVLTCQVSGEVNFIAGHHWLFQLFDSSSLSWSRLEPSFISSDLLICDIILYARYSRNCIKLSMIAASSPSFLSINIVVVGVSQILSACRFFEGVTP